MPTHVKMIRRLFGTSGSGGSRGNSPAQAAPNEDQDAALQTPADDQAVTGGAFASASPPAMTSEAPDANANNYQQEEEEDELDELEDDSDSEAGVPLRQAYMAAGGGSNAGKTPTGPRSSDASKTDYTDRRSKMPPMPSKSSETKAMPVPSTAPISEEIFANEKAAKGHVRRRAWEAGYDRRIKWNPTPPNKAAPFYDCTSTACPFYMEVATVEGDESGKCKVIFRSDHNDECKATFNSSDGAGWGVPDDVKDYLDDQIRQEVEAIKADPKYKKPGVSAILNDMKNIGLAWDRIQVGHTPPIWC